MGWTYTHKEPGQGIRSFFEREFNYGKIIDCAVVNFRTAYMAYEIKRMNDPKPRIIALVVLLDYAPHDYHNFGYKNMGQSPPTEVGGLRGNP